MTCGLHAMERDDNATEKELRRGSIAFGTKIPSLDDLKTPSQDQDQRRVLSRTLSGTDLAKKNHTITPQLSRKLSDKELSSTRSLYRAIKNADQKAAEKHLKKGANLFLSDSVDRKNSFEKLFDQVNIIDSRSEERYKIYSNILYHFLSNPVSFPGLNIIAVTPFLQRYHKALKKNNRQDESQLSKHFMRHIESKQEELDTQLFNAARNDIKSFIGLIIQGANINAQSSVNKTPLMALMETLKDNPKKTLGVQEALGFIFSEHVVPHIKWTQKTKLNMTLSDFCSKEVMIARLNTSSLDAVTQMQQIASGEERANLAVRLSFISYITENNPEMIQRALALGADVNQQEIGTHFTPLMAMLRTLNNHRKEPHGQAYIDAWTTAHHFLNNFSKKIDFLLKNKSGQTAEEVALEYEMPNLYAIIKFGTACDEASSKIITAHAIKSANND